MFTERRGFYATAEGPKKTLSDMTGECHRVWKDKDFEPREETMKKLRNYSHFIASSALRATKGHWLFIMGFLVACVFVGILDFLLSNKLQHVQGPLGLHTFPLVN